MITKLLRVSRRGWIVFLIAFVAAFIMASASGAQENSEEIAEKYGIRFPISELGNCSDISDCRNFCEDPVNSSDCINYAKAKGFYKEEEIEDKSRILKKAKSVLGCDSRESCRSFCQIPTNFEKCDAFAKNEGLSGGQVEDPAKKQILEKAKEILGCDSYSSCASFCSDDGNRQKCSQFAKETGLRGGEKPVGPGGCTSEETCKSFCSDPQNFPVCKGFASSSGGRFEGPGGCNSESTCRSYCQEHTDECRSFGRPEPGGSSMTGFYNPQEMCNRTPACAWKDNTCQCGMYNRDNQGNQAEDFAKYCRENPGRCTPGGIGGFESRGEREEFGKFCRENPDRCRPVYSNVTGGAPFDPALECGKYQGCSWQGGSCACSNTYSPQNLAERERSCTSGGCRWTGNGCDCSSANMDSPAMACTRQAGCSWINSACQCSSFETRPASSGGGTTSGSSGSYGSREDQERGCRSGGGTCDWSYGYCYCRGYQSSYNAPTSGEGSYTGGSGTTTTSGGTYSGGSYSGSGTYSGSGSYYSGNMMSRDQQEATCRSGGGTCSWNGDTCNCQGYRSTSNGTTTNTSTTNTTQNTAPSGMSRDSQEAGCRSCGGTCSWSGDFCNCQCAGSTSGGSSGGSTTTTTQTAPAPAPVQETQPAPAPVQEQTPSEPAPAPAVQGVTIVRGMFGWFLDLFR